MFRHRQRAVQPQSKPGDGVSDLAAPPTVPKILKIRRNPQRSTGIFHNFRGAPSVQHVTPLPLIC
jgi:hypothetical protein